LLWDNWAKMDLFPSIFVAILLPASGLLARAQPALCSNVPPGSLERAACHERLRQWREAEEVYRAHLKAHRDSLPAALGHIEVLLQIEEAARRQHNLDGAVEQAVEASEELAKLVETHPDEPAVLKLKAWVLENVEKNPSAAEQVLTKITRIAPRDGDAWSLLCSFYLDSQRIDEGIRCFESAVALNSANPLYRAGLARGYGAAGRPAEAEKAFAAALATAQPDSNPLVFLWYGDFLAFAERYDESGKAYSRIIGADPGNGEAWLKRAAVDVKAGQYHKAEKDALEALAQGAGEREAQAVLLRVYRGLGDDARAQAAAAALERATDVEEARRAKWRRAKTALEQAERLMQADRFSEALPLYDSVTKDVPGYAEAWFAAGMCYAHTAEAERAEQSFRTFLRLQPLSADGHSALGLLLLSQQRIAEARAELQEALRLDPASTEAHEALDSLAAHAR
jgi:tetratricopeptide (TPR) repeat protein